MTRSQVHRTLIKEVIPFGRCNSYGMENSDGKYIKIAFQLDMESGDDTWWMVILREEKAISFLSALGKCLAERSTANGD